VTTASAYVPCQCPKCAHRPVHGVCRCRVCAGATPESIRASQDARRIQEAQVRAGQLLVLEDTRPLTEEEALELDRALAYLTRRT
jgi:hypothetical protein